MRSSTPLVLSFFLLMSACAGHKKAVDQSGEAVRDTPNPADTEVGMTEMDPELKEALRAAAAGVEDVTLAGILRDHWLWLMSRYPLWATDLGLHTFDDQIGDNSKAAREAGKETMKDFLVRARSIDPTSLSAADEVTRRLFVEELEASLLVDETCRFDLWSLSARNNPITRWNYLPERHKITDGKSAANLLARYRRIDVHIRNEIMALREGAGQGLYANAESTSRVLDMVEQQLGEPIDDWELLKPMSAEVDGWDEDKLTRFRFELKEVVTMRIKKALEAYSALLEEELLPDARPVGSEGVGALPGGAACYQALIRSHTGLGRTAQDIHDTGLRELERINEEMRALGEKLFGTPDLAATLERLRTDPELYFDTEEEVEQAAVDGVAAADAAMGDWFGILPKADCTVTRIPDYEAPYTTIAYYRQPAPDGSRPGQYYINTYKPETRPRFEAKVLAYHESIPGHHLQIAISQELPELPAFRKHGGWTVFVEGWALYTERLSDEMGLYDSDLDRMGMLSFDAWRASRLVVDTGIHSMGWSREQAKQFMAEHTALALNNIDNEVDRYISWPGQALAYKLGQLEILQMREKARLELGDNFDIKGFHDTVLGRGAVTMAVLRDQIRDWIAANR